MNIFKAYKHISSRKPRPERVELMDGEVILMPGEETSYLHHLLSGTVLAYGLDGPEEGQASLRTRTYRRYNEKEPSPIFGAENYFYCRPSELVYRAIGRVELCRVGSDVVLDLGQNDAILDLTRELIRNSDLSERLLVRLQDKYEETKGIAGFNPALPRDILKADEASHGLLYKQFARELLVELFNERRARAEMQTTKIVALTRQPFPLTQFKSF